MNADLLKRLTVAAAAVYMLSGCAAPEIVKDDASAKAAEPVSAPAPTPEPAPAPVETQVSTTIVEEPVKEAVVEKKEEPAPAPAPTVQEKVELFTIYFDYDKYAIRDADKDNLMKDADALKDRPEFKVRIEGHADERGETEYNLALGDKRAKSVERYLTTLGINPVRLSTISYGEERPAVSGHDEAAWSKNRRVEFKGVE